MLSLPDLRKYLRHQRVLLSASNRIHFNHLINQHLVNSKLLIRCSSIASYLATNTEVDLLPMIKVCSDRRVPHFLPVTQKNHRLLFHHYRCGEHVYPNKYGILEPALQQPRQAKFVAAIILPLVGFDAEGNRLGMGGGYYDRTLAFSRDINCRQRPILIGAAYQLQKVDRIHSNNWDIPLDAAVTEEGITLFTKRAKFLL